MAATVNTSSQFAGAITRTIDRKALQVAQRYLVLYQFADKKTLDHGHGVTCHCRPPPSPRACRRRRTS